MSTSTQATDTRRVVVHNDETTTALFVISAMHDVFGLPYSQAVTVTGSTHRDGAAIVGEYDALTAQSKIAEFETLAQSKGSSLRVTIESSEWENTEQHAGHPDDERVHNAFELLAFLCRELEDGGIAFEIAIVNGMLQIRQLDVPQDEPVVEVTVSLSPEE